MSQFLRHDLTEDLLSVVSILVFRSSHFSFLVFGLFCRQSYENMKTLRDLHLHFARQDGQDIKKGKENHATKVTKIPKTRRQKYGMNET